MSTETLHQLLTALLTVGCAPLITWLMDQLKQEFTPSPKTARRLTLLLSVVAPSIVYGLLAAIQGLYEWPAHLLAIVGAFTGSTMIHGEKTLPTGAEQRVDELLAVPDAIAASKLDEERK